MPEERAKHIGEELGYAMQLEYLGKKQGTRAPEVVTSWIADADLDALSAGKPVSAVSVAVLLTKNQLSDLQRQLKIIIDNAERTRKTDSRDFFQGILSASAQLAREIRRLLPEARRKPPRYGRTRRIPRRSALQE